MDGNRYSSIYKEINPKEVIVKGDDVDEDDIQWVNGTKEISKAELKQR